MESGILQKCLSPPSYLSDPRSGDGSNLSEGKEISAEIEEEIKILAEFPPRSGNDVEEGKERSNENEDEIQILGVFPSRSQRSQSGNDVPIQQTSGSENTRDGDPEREVVSFTLVLNHLCSARMFPMSVLSVVY